MLQEFFFCEMVLGVHDEHIFPIWLWLHINQVCLPPVPGPWGQDWLDYQTLFDPWLFQAHFKQESFNKLMLAYFFLGLSCIISLPPWLHISCSLFKTSYISSTGTNLKLLPGLTSFLNPIPSKSITIMGLPYIKLVSESVGLTPLFSKSSSLLAMVEE